MGTDDTSTKIQHWPDSHNMSQREALLGLKEGRSIKEMADEKRIRPDSQYRSINEII